MKTATYDLNAHARTLAAAWLAGEGDAVIIAIRDNENPAALAVATDRALRGSDAMGWMTFLVALRLGCSR